ncbi:MAG: hypothetical protein ABIW16_02610 [Sphingomicrobium sp.]
MPKSASEVMGAVLFSAVLDAVDALKRASGGLPNQLLRDLQSIHPNTTVADLPKALQESISASVRAAFTQLLKEGYAVGPKGEMQQSRPIDRVPERERRTPPPRGRGDRSAARDPRTGPGRGPRGGDRGGAPRGAPPGGKPRG